MYMEVSMKIDNFADNSDLEALQKRIEQSPSYKLASDDVDFLNRDSLRPVRMQLELLKPEMALVEQNVRSTIVVFGGTQIVERPIAEDRLRAAKEALSQAPDNAILQRTALRAERVLA